MSNTNKKSRTGIIAIIVVLVIMAVPAAVFIFSTLKHFESVCTDQYSADDTHAYHYTGHTSLASYYIDSDTDLEAVLEDNDPDSADSLGEQDLKVRVTGMRLYKTDMMGIYVQYPVFVYEYTGE
ncbi:MAG: hypothetical protein K6A80_07265 [Saccharofermentans sp.]|nr:hypothetical protein [Saccharofermentans sp.]